MVKECPNPEKTRQVQGEDGKTVEIYVPSSTPDGELFNDDIPSGVNYDKYDNVPVKVSGDNVPPSITSLHSAGLRPILVDNINKAKYAKATPVQKVCLPIVMAGRDLMACADTGSGKTAAFLIPIIHKLIESNAESNCGARVQKPQCLIILPTRELTRQVYKQARKFSLGSMIRCCLAYGQTSSSHQLANLTQGCNILAATPGRLLMFMDRGQISLENLKFLVFDEADKMLATGFLDDMKKCLNDPTMPSKGERQTLLFSATFKDEIQVVAQEFMKDDYLFAAVGKKNMASPNVTQEVLAVPRFDKREKLMEIIQENPTNKTLVFVKTN